MTNNQSKAKLAREIVQSNPTLDTKKLIDLLCDKLMFSRPVARTYLYNARKSNNKAPSRFVPYFIRVLEFNLLHEVVNDYSTIVDVCRSG
jgi:hypothetical protein